MSLIIGRDYDVVDSDLPGAEIYTIPQLVKYVSPQFDCKAPGEIKKVLTKIKPDIVHTHLAKGGILGRLAARSANVPCIMHTVHGPTFPPQISLYKRIIYWTLERVCGCFTSHFVFVGRELQQTYIRAGVCSGENSHVIYTGRPDSAIDRRALSETDRKLLRTELSAGHANDKLVVTVGRLVPAKQLEHAVEIIFKLRQSGVQARLAIIGKSLLMEEQSYEQKILQLARDMKVEDLVVFTGFRTDIPDIMDAADAVLLTSRYEGLPNVAVEAIIAKTPMVAYSVSGIAEVLKHKKTGYIVKQDDVHEAVSGLLLCFSGDIGKLQENEKASYAILDSFRESTMLQRKMKLYEQVFCSLKCGD